MMVRPIWLTWGPMRVNVYVRVGPHEVMLVSGKQTQWLDYLPTRVLAMTATVFFSAVAMEDGSVNVYTSTGRRCVRVLSSVACRPNCSLRRLMPTLTLGSPCYAMDSSRYSLMVVTSSGQLHSWLVLFWLPSISLAKIFLKEYENTNVAFPRNLHFPPSRRISKPYHTLCNSPAQRSSYNSMFERDSPLIRGISDVMDQTQRALVG